MTKPGRQTSFRSSLLNPAEFTLTFELVPSRGGRGKEYSRIISLAEEIAMDGRIKAVSITENAGGHPALSPEVLGLDIVGMGLDVINHFSGKDKNRNQMESLLFGWEREGLNNLLVISGDYPKQGYCGHAKPVFDLDSVQMIAMLSEMNRGEISGKPRPRTSFFKGVALSPFKSGEAELMMQYYKLHRKVAAGADFIITQIGFAARKFQEVLFYLQENRLNIPVLGNVFVPNLAVLKIMRQGGVPGCVIPVDLDRRMMTEAETADKGRTARLLRGAKLLAILKGLGYSGAHIGGPGLNFVGLDFMLNKFNEFTDSWKELIAEMNYWADNSFFYFQLDKTSGLNLPEPVKIKERTKLRPGFMLARMAHNLAFDPEGLLFTAARKSCFILEQGMPAFLRRGERLSKILLFNCKDCGDCTLVEQTFLCPQSGCAKFLLNGPCGGSRDGWCEVYPGKKRCHYVRVYERLSAVEKENFKEKFIPPRNWALNGTSSWFNFYAGLDHRGQEHCRFRKADRE